MKYIRYSNTEEGFNTLSESCNDLPLLIGGPTPNLVFSLGKNTVENAINGILGDNEECAETSETDYVK